MSRSVTAKQLDDEDSAGWTTYGTSFLRGWFSLFLTRRPSRYARLLHQYGGVYESCGVAEIYHQRNRGQRELRKTKGAKGRHKQSCAFRASLQARL